MNLICAVKSNDNLAIDGLIKHSDINSVDESGYTALHWGGN